MRIRNLLLICLFSFLLFANNVYANEDTTCSYTNKANLKKSAAKITASYEIKNDTESPYFIISIFNVMDDVVVSVKSDKEGSSAIFITYDKLKDGVYSFENNDIETIETYTINISSLKYDCPDVIRSFKLVKPRRNAVHDNPECSFLDSTNSFYCQEWVTKNFNYTDDVIIQKIKKQRLNNEKKTTTKKVVEEKEKSFFDKLKGVTLYIVLGLVGAILIDLILIVFDINRIRKEDDI